MKVIHEASHQDSHWGRPQWDGSTFGFAYPASPLPIALNMISKVLAFAAAVSLFLAPEKSAWFVRQPVLANPESGQ